MSTSPDSVPRELALRVFPDPVLRRICEPVERFDGSLHGLLEDIHHVMLRHGGIGLARVVRHEIDHLGGRLISDHRRQDTEHGGPAA
jgi:peptide deformylase